MSFIKVGLIFAIPTLAKLLAGLAVVKIIALYLGADGLGRLGQFMSLMTMLSILASGGISTGIVKYVAEHKNNKEYFIKYIQTASFITLFSSSCIAVVFFVFSEKISIFLFGVDSYFIEIRVLAVVQFSIAFSSFLFGILNGTQNVKYFALINLGTVLIGSVGVLVGCIWFGFVGALYGMMWYSACQIVFLIIWYHFSFDEPWSFVTPKLDLFVAKKYIKFSFMQITSVCTMQLSQVAMRKIIESNASWVEVGYWQGLTKISDVYLQFITIVLANYYLPRLSGIFDKKLVIKEVISAYKVVLPILLILAPSIIIFRDRIILLLFSSDFLPMSELFVWQIMGDFFKIVAYVAAYVAVSKAAIKIYISAEIFQATLLVVFCYVLVSHFGLIGAVYAYAATYAIYAITALLALYIFNKK